MKVRLAFDVRDGVNDQIKYLRGMVIDTTRPEMNVKRDGQLDEVTQRTNSAMKKVEDIQVTPVGKKKIASLLASSQTFEKVKAELITLIKAGDFDATSTYVLKSMTATQNKFLQDAVNFANSQDAQLCSEGQGIVENITITLIFSALAILASIMLGYFLTRSIVRPLVAAVERI